MKYDLEFIIFDFCTKKFIYMISLIFCWGIVFPFLVHKAEITISHQLDYANYFNYFQIFITFIFVCYLFIFSRNIINPSQVEILYSIDHHSKIRLFFYCFLVYQIVLIPFYAVTLHYFMYDIAILEIFNIFFEQIFLLSMYYCFSYFTYSSLLSFAIILGYILLFTIIFKYSLLFNIYHFDISITISSFSHYALFTILIILYLIVGRYYEREVLK